MKLLTILCPSLLLLVPLTPQESPELKEAAELSESVVKLFNQSKYDDALKPAKQALEIRERLLPFNEIDETGTVVEAKDMCGGPLYLSESSVQAAYGARFSPTKLSGKPVPVYGIIHFRFVAF